VVAATGVGFVFGATQAINLATGNARLLVDGNEFQAFTHAINDSTATTDIYRDTSGLSVFSDTNRMIGPLGLACQATTNGGRQFAVMKPQASDPNPHYDNYPRLNETTGIKNRLTVNSEDGTTWGTLPDTALSGTSNVSASTSVTFSTAQTLSQGTFLTFASQAGTYYQLAAPVNAGLTGTLTVAYSGTPNAATVATQFNAMAANGATDPLGTTRAITLTRSGVSSALGVSVYPSNAMAEGFALGFDQTNMGTVGFVDFWAQAGTLGMLSLWIESSNGNFVLWRTVTLGSAWQRYRFTFVPQTTLGLRIVPGGIDAMAGTVVVAFPTVNDNGCDYVPSPGTDPVTLTSGNRWERQIIAYGGIGGLPITSLGSTSNVTLAKTGGSGPTTAAQNCWILTTRPSGCRRGGEAVKCLLYRHS
jgi:hypothetical protein